MENENEAYIDYTEEDKVDNLGIGEDFLGLDNFSMEMNVDDVFGDFDLGI